MTHNRNDSNFVQEYLYIEEYPLDIMEHEYVSKGKNKTDEALRGVCVIDILGNEED